MSPGLIAGIAGLAALDSLNPATIGLITLILLLPERPGADTVDGARRHSRRQVLLAAGVVAGAAATVVVAGLVAFTAAQGLAVAGGLSWVRRIAFAAAALALLVIGIRRLRTRHRPTVALPGWFSPLTAVPVGVVVTGADLPNAFPYFIAIERLVTAGTAAPVAVLVLIGYGVVYCLPCLVLLAVGSIAGERVRGRLARIYDRYGSAREVPASRTAALGYGVAAAAVIALAALV